MGRNKIAFVGAIKWKNMPKEIIEFLINKKNLPKKHETLKDELFL